MSILEDLQALDLSAVLDGKIDIAAVLDSEAIQRLIQDGGATRVLGDLGVVLQTAVNGFENPQALIDPITHLLTGVLDKIGAENPALGEFVEAVTKGARLVADLVKMLSGDPKQFAAGSGPNLGSLLDRVGGTFGDHASVVTGGLGRFRALVATVERGLPSDPEALLAPALQILLPIPTDSIQAVKTWSGGLTAQFDAIAIEPRLTEGLVAALGEVRVAAEAGDRVRVEAALRAVTDVRTHTIQQLADALRRVASQVSAIRLGDGLSTLSSLRGVLANADDNVFELLSGWKSMIADVREVIESIDPADAVARFSTILDAVEAKANEILLSAIDGAVEVVKQALRDLFREIPLRPLRTKVSEAIASLAHAIDDLDLDAPIEAIRGGLHQLSSLLETADPAALVQAAVGELEDLLRTALDALESAMGRITAGIEAVADQAEAVLSRAVEGLRTFRTVTDEIVAAIDDLGITEAAQQIAETIGDLREQVSTLLADAPLPDMLRDSVSQLIQLLDSIDLDAAIREPLSQVAAKLQIPESVGTTVTEALEKIAETVDSLVPTNVIAGLEQMLQDALSEIENLDLSQLTAGLSGVLDGAAGVFEGIHIATLIEPAGEVFDRILAAVDRVHPRVLLKPIIDLYAQILGAIPVPNPETMTTRAASVASQAGESVARAAAEPMRQAVDPSATTPPAGADSGPAREEPPTDLRPGDVVRLIGFLPNKLREALHSLDTGAAASFLARIDDLGRGTATALRQVRDAIASLDGRITARLEAVLAPVTSAQIDAQLALEGSVVVSADGFDAEASFSLLASVHPAAMSGTLGGELAVITGRCQQVCGQLRGSLASDLDSAADLLESLMPSAILGDLDALLAALDPEPIAAELDALFVTIVDAMPAFLAAVGDALREIERRIRHLIGIFNPGALAQRFLKVLDVVREELSLLDPGRLADELGEVHAQIKAVLMAYDPRALAAELDQLLVQLAATIRGLDPAGLMPDLTGIRAQVDRLSDILPVNALAGIGTQLEAVGAELRELDVVGMIEAINSLGPDVAEGIDILIEAVRDELVALLESVRYSSSSGSASASVSGGGSIG